MDNVERRQKLAHARKRAVDWAEVAESNRAAGSNVTDQSVNFACMWSDVAQALKVGDPSSDGV